MFTPWFGRFVARPECLTSSMRRIGAVTLCLAGLAGVAAGWWALRAWPEYRALRAIRAVDPSARLDGWTWLRRTEGPDRRPRARRLRGKILDAVAAAPEIALLDAGNALRGYRMWDFEHVAPDLLLRELALRAGSSDETDQHTAAREMARCPLDAPPEETLSIFDALLSSTSPSVRETALEAACGWLGRERAHRLDELSGPDADHALHRLGILARSWARTPGRPPPLDPDDPPDLLEAKLLYATRADPDDATALLEARERWSGRPRPAFEYILGYSLDPRADRARTEPDQAPPADGPARPDTSVYAAALLAERRLAPKRASALAASWIHDLNDDRKRAGALLAALLGEHQDLLAQAYEREDIALVKTTQRLALHALGRPVGGDDPIEFAYRVLHRPDGDFNPDAALCLLAAGHRDALVLLTTPPHPGGSASRGSIRQRSRLIERFVPGWDQAVEEPAGDDQRGLRLHADLLRALRMLTQRRLVFDPQTRTYEEEGAEALKGTP